MTACPDPNHPCPAPRPAAETSTEHDETSEHPYMLSIFQQRMDCKNLSPHHPPSPPTPHHQYRHHHHINAVATKSGPHLCRLHSIPAVHMESRGIAIPPIHLNPLTPQPRTARRSPNLPGPPLPPRTYPLPPTAVDTMPFYLMAAAIPNASRQRSAHLFARSSPTPPSFPSSPAGKTPTSTKQQIRRTCTI